MSIFSKFLSLSAGVPRTVDLSQNTLAVQGLQINAATGGGAITQLAHASTSSYTISWPAAQAGGSNYVLANDGTGNLSWIAAATGSVTSVTASAPLSSSGGTTPNITISQATTSTDGYLSSTDWNTFNNKQPAGNYITALTGDVAASGPGSASATIQANVVSNSKLAQMGAHTIKGNNTGSTANASDLSVAQVTAMLNLFTSSLQGLVPASGGGTTNFLRADGTWAAPVGSVTSVALADGSTSPIYSISGSPVTSSGTLTFTLNNQSANTVFAGPSSGGAAQPGFRSLVSNDIPDLSSLYLPLSGGTMSGVLDMGGNKITNLANGTSANDAVNYAQLQAVGTGLIWQQSVNDPDLVDDSLSTPPGSPVYSLTYIIASSPTGAWTGLAGHAVWWDGSHWIDLSTGNPLTGGQGSPVQVGDRFGVAIASPGGPAHVGGGLTGKVNYLAQITNNTPGSIAYTFTAPVASYAFSVTDPGSQHYGSSFTYSGTLSEWVDFSGPSKIVAGNALQYSGNTLNVLFDGTSVDINGSNQLEIKAQGVSPAKLGAVAGNGLTGGSGSALAVLAASGGALTSASGGVSVNVSSTGGVYITSNNLALKLADTSLATGSSGVQVNLAASSGLTVSSGLKVNTDGTSIDVNGSNQVEIKNGGVSAAKLGSVTDGITLDQSGAGSTLEIKSGGVGTTQLANNAVTAAKVDTSVFDQDTITGGNGSAAAVQYAPLLQKRLNAGQSFSANTSYIVRFGMNSLSESADEIYAADYDASSADKFWAVGIAQSGSSVIAGQPMMVVMKGTYTLGSSDTAFNASDVGKPVFLTASGAFSTTAPSSSNQAVFKIGIVESTSTIFVDGQMMGVA